ncbi:hypothetical protein WA026_015318 [Henosepilachna vigintioctopunctata]|uniref:RNase H type-1 domain-containing protein n=1 Tax=Henosepilachna vigintioctopunctata TaxID=420089 RepID=A0AAW1TTQ6_9CUCU
MLIIIYNLGLFKTSLDVIIPSYQSASEREQFFDIVNNQFAGYHKLYTDASKSSSSATGVAVFDPCLKLSELSTLNKNCSIFHGELYAIKLSLQFILKHRLKFHSNRILILLSQSALISLRNLKFDTSLTQVHKDVLLFLLEVEQNNHIRFLWIKSHIGVFPNDKVDEFAKLAAKNPVVHSKCFSSEVYGM